MQVVDITPCHYSGYVETPKDEQRSCRLRSRILRRSAALRSCNLRHSLIAKPRAAHDEIRNSTRSLTRISTPGPGNLLRHPRLPMQPLSYVGAETNAFGPERLDEPAAVLRNKMRRPYPCCRLLSVRRSICDRFPGRRFAARVWPDSNRFLFVLGGLIVGLATLLRRIQRVDAGKRHETLMPGRLTATEVLISLVLACGVGVFILEIPALVPLACYAYTISDSALALVVLGVIVSVWRHIGRMTHH